jgi:hypothetical protein
MKDFWTGLPSLLERHFSPSDAKKVAAAFDSLHYGSLRQLCYEDAADLAALIARETRPPAEAGPLREHLPHRDRQQPDKAVTGPLTGPGALA